MNIDAAGTTHIGRRSNNEDAFDTEPSLGLFVVADGMGGYEGGEVASRIVVETVMAFVRRDAADGEATWPFAADRTLTYDENVLATALRLAHVAVGSRKTGRLVSMGSTAAVLQLRDGVAVVANVGDSRVLRWREGALQTLSREHSLYAEMRAANLIDPAVSRADFPHANVITRAIGMNGPAAPHVATFDARPGDVFLLCSDGLTEPLGDPDLAAILVHAPARDVADELVHEAFARGGRDNITAVVARVIDDADVRPSRSTMGASRAC